MYPKHILDIEQQIEAFLSSGMGITSIDVAKDALTTIGYYRLRGYCFHLYNNQEKKYCQGTTFSNLVRLYYFDRKLSHLLFGMSSDIEVALRVRLVDALLVHEDALILYSPELFANKKLYWQNLGILAGEIARSNDVFIQHNFQNHEGNIPVWAAVEIMSFGNLSKTIKNLKTGEGSSASRLTSYYKYLSPKNRLVNPSLQMLCSWIQAVSILRNICAHNSRIYNRNINTHVQILDIDRPQQPIRHSGLYQIILAMKYLRPNDTVWQEFFSSLKKLLVDNSEIVELARLNFPTDWEKHLLIVNGI